MQLHTGRCCLLCSTHRDPPTCCAILACLRWALDEPCSTKGAGPPWGCRLRTVGIAWLAFECTFTMWCAEVGDKFPGLAPCTYGTPAATAAADCCCCCCCVWSSASKGVASGEGKCRLVRSGKEPVLLETGMWTPESCSGDGYMLQGSSRGHLCQTLENRQWLMLCM